MSNLTVIREHLRRFFVPRRPSRAASSNNFTPAGQRITHLLFRRVFFHVLTEPAAMRNNPTAGKLPRLPKGYSRSYSQVFDAEGKAVFSKWWMTASCRDAFIREHDIKAARLELARAAKAAARAAEETEPVSGRLCKGCRKVAVDFRKNYCGKCAADSKRKANRVAQRRKRGGDVRNPVLGALQAEALTEQVLSDRCPDLQHQFSTVKS
jgi:hypothetical protein